MMEIDIKAFFRGVNARRGNVSITSPSSMPPSELGLVGNFLITENGLMILTESGDTLVLET